jgi:hypothetical protein
MIRIEKYLKTGKFGWRAQFATSNQDIMGIRIPPFAFSEHGILMLSSALKSERAVQVNIQIMRTFTKLREALLDNKDLRKELGELKQITEGRFQVVFETLDQLLTIESKPKKIYPVQSLFAACA